MQISPYFSRGGKGGTQTTGAADFYFEAVT